MDKLSVIMPCFILNEEILVLTQNAIDSLGDVHLIIIDNASPAGGGLLRDRADLYIRNKSNLGYAIAVNEGIKLSKNEFIAIANNDIRVSKNWQEVTQEIIK